VKFNPKKAWNTKRPNWLTDQSDDSSVRLRDVRKKRSESGYRPGDVLVKIHFVLPRIPQETWSGWERGRRNDEMHKLEVEIEKRKVGKSVRWNDRRFFESDGMPKTYPKRDDVWPSAFFVAMEVA